MNIVLKLFSLSKAMIHGTMSPHPFSNYLSLVLMIDLSQLLN